MRITYKRWSPAIAALASAFAALVLSLGALVVLSAPSSAQPTVLAACTYPAWAEGNSYKVGDKVAYSGKGYEALVAHTAWPGANWNPASTPTLWRELGACDGSTPHYAADHAAHHAAYDAADHASHHAAARGRHLCGEVEARRKVLQGYWENWDGASNGVHPPFGWTPIDNPVIKQHGYNVINAAFPVIRSDGTVLWEDGMDSTVKVATPPRCARRRPRAPPS